MKKTQDQTNAVAAYIRARDLLTVAQDARRAADQTTEQANLDMQAAWSQVRKLNTPFGAYVFPGRVLIVATTDYPMPADTID